MRINDQQTNSMSPRVEPTVRATRGNGRWAIALALGLGLVQLGVSTKPAAAEGCQDNSEGDKKGKFHTEIVNGKRVVVIDTQVTVCGKVPKPSVVYVLTAKNINYEWETLKQDFMPLILNTARKAPL